MNPLISQITKAGYRLTTPRKTILSIVTEDPLTAQEIYQKLLNENKQYDLATVYRNLELLVQLKLVTKVQFGTGSARYEKTGKAHHHHLICEHCGSIEDIHLKEKALLQQITQTSTFKVERHSLEFFGLCKNCK